MRIRVTFTCAASTFKNRLLTSNATHDFNTAAIRAPNRMLRFFISKFGSLAPVFSILGCLHCRVRAFLGQHGGAFLFDEFGPPELFYGVLHFGFGWFAIGPEPTQRFCEI